MSLNQSIPGGNSESDTTEKNLDQFEICKYKGNSDSDKEDACKYRDNQGRCIFETCIYDNEFPPQTILWNFTCIACGDPCSIIPRKMKIHFCDRCRNQLRTAQKLPFECIICGRSQSSPAKGFGNQICDHCIGRLKKYVDQWHCEHCG